MGNTDKIPNLIIRAIRKIRRLFPICNVNGTSYERNCLMAYIRAPFLEKKTGDSHQNAGQSREIAKILGDFGYNVDVIDYFDRPCIFTKKYDMVFDISVTDNPVYWNHLKSDAKKVAYFTGSEPKFANAAEKERIRGVKERRGAVLEPRRQAPLFSRKVEEFDTAIMIGNQHNLDTYSGYALKQTSLVCNTGYTFDFTIGHKKSAKKFAYFGSGGTVHKGLDLLLEVFAEPGFPADLYVCGSFEWEQDFVDAYHKELYETPNIHPLGYMNIRSDAFREVAENCAYTILPSCSEGQAGAITTMMSAGVIPICSKNCGFDGDDVILLPDCSIETIRSIVLEYADKTPQWVVQHAQIAKNTVDTKYSMSAFSEQMRKALAKIM